MSACGISNTIDSLEGVIEETQEKQFVIDCSEEINKNKNPRDSIGYYCQIFLHQQTMYEDRTGKPLTIHDFKKGDRIRILLSTAQPVNEEERQFEASKITLLESNPQ